MKKKYKFAVGDRVGTLLDYNNNDKLVPIIYLEMKPDYGTITELCPHNEATIKWDYEYDDYLNPIELEKLAPEEECKKEISRLEKEYRLLQKEISLKVKEAAKNIKEANTLAKKQGLVLADIYDIIDPLYSAMDKAGWNTSSFGC